MQKTKREKAMDIVQKYIDDVDVLEKNTKSKKEKYAYRAQWYVLNDVKANISRELM
jgi:hypothetical protein